MKKKTLTLLLVLSALNTKAGALSLVELAQKCLNRLPFVLYDKIV